MGPEAEYFVAVRRLHTIIPQLDRDFVIALADELDEMLSADPPSSQPQPQRPLPPSEPWTSCQTRQTNQHDPDDFA